ncbi:MAG: hypothetical protein JWQ53_1946 [Klenkia sp.]|nr:hypothetical protein [Klenkia sp.]
MSSVVTYAPVSLDGVADYRSAADGVSAAAAARSCSRVRTSSAEYARRSRSSRAMTTPLAATPARPASPSSFPTVARRMPAR